MASRRRSNHDPAAAVAVAAAAGRDPVMAAVGGFPGHAAGHARRQPLRGLWAEVIARREAWHRVDGPDSMETWAAYDPAWRDRLDDVCDTACDAAQGRCEVDPRAALVDVLAVASAWIDVMGEPDGG